MLVSRASLRAIRSACGSEQSTNALTAAAPSGRVSMWNTRGATLRRFRVAPTRKIKSASASARMSNVAAPAGRAVLSRAPSSSAYTSAVIRQLARSIAAGHRLRDRLGLVQYAQYVAAREFRDVRVTPPTTHQLGEQVRVVRHIAQPRGQLLPHTVEIRADADMIDARDLGDVLDVIGDHRESDAGLRMSAFPF